MKKQRASGGSTMRKYYQLILVLVCCISVISLLVYRHEYYRLRYVLEVLNIFGKPGLSEVEFCGPGFNATLLTQVLHNSSHELRESAPLFQQIDENFYTYSSFLRHNPKHDKLESSYVYETDTIAVGKVNIEPKFRCNVWLEDSTKPKSAKFSYKTIKDDGNYMVYVFRCSINKDFGKPIALGFYSNDHKVNPLFTPVTRLILVSAKRISRQSASIRFVNNVDLAACVIPNEIPLVSKSSIVEFLAFHQMMGVRQFIVYDSTVSEDVIKRINLLPPDLTKWDIKFFPLNFPFIFSKSYGIIRSVIELDCIFRNLQIDKEVYTRTSHLVTLSWDEFVVPRYHHNLKALLGDFDPMRKFKKIDVSRLNFCCNQRDDPKVKPDYPTIVKKTSYYKMPHRNDRIAISNLDSVNSFEGILEMVLSTNKTIPEDVLAVHKYAECGNGVDYDPENNENLNLNPHKFEGAMLKFAGDLHNNKIFRLYKTGHIWERPAEPIRDML